MSNIIETTASEISTTYKEAISLHKQIVESGNAAAASLFEMARCLKRMRDLKLYTELKFTSFDDYVEQMVGIKKRQAYNYISTYERFGEKFLTENGNLGITKLSLLAQVPAPELDDFMKENDVEGSSVSRVKELVEQIKNQGEQLSLLQAENDQLKGSEYDTEEREKMLESQQNEIDKKETEITVLQEKLKQLEQSQVKPPQLDEKAMEKIRKDAEKAAKAKVKADLEKAKQAADEKIRKAESEAAERIKKAEKELQLKSSAATQEVMIHFGYFQDTFNKLVSKIQEEKRDNPENGAKLAGALMKMFERYEPISKKLCEEEI